MTQNQREEHMSDEKKNRDYAQQQMQYGSKAAKGTVTPPKGYEPAPVKPAPSRVITGFRIPVLDEEEDEDEEEESYETYKDMEFERDANGTVTLAPKEQSFIKEEDLKDRSELDNWSGFIPNIQVVTPVKVEPPKPEPKMKMILDRLLFDGHDVRTAIKDDGSIWFVLKDVCDVIGIEHHRDVARRLDEEQKAGVDLTHVSSNGVEQKRETTVISEDGLYSVILKSRSPKAEPFQIWIEEEVLPSIRKTGGYQDAPQFNVPTNFADALLLAQLGGYAYRGPNRKQVKMLLIPAGLIRKCPNPINRGQKESPCVIKWS